MIKQEKTQGQELKQSRKPIWKCKPTGKLGRAFGVVLTLVLVLILGLALAFALTSRTETTIFVASDIHYIAKELYDDGDAFKKYMEGSNGRNFLYIDEVVRAFAHEIERQKPHALIISGDLTNNGEKINHQKLAAMLSELEAASETKIYVIPGNHDINNPWARRFEGDEMQEIDSVSPEEFAEIYGEFGYNEAISKDEFTLSYLVAPTDNLWLIMLDTNMYRLNSEFGTPTVNGTLFEETLEWMEKCVKMAEESGAQVITVSHHNLLRHSENKYFGYTINSSERAVAVYEKLRIPLNLSGHIHAQSTKVQEYKNGTIYDIATGTMCSFPTRYAVLKHRPGKQFTYETYSVDVESWAKAIGIEDENVLNFNSYSKNLYLDHVYSRYYGNLLKTGKYTEYEMVEMAKTMSLVNAVRFAGFSFEESHVLEEIKSTPGYELWLKDDPDFSDLLKPKNPVTIIVKQKTREV